MRKGEGVLFNSAKDAAVIFVYVTQTKKHALNGDAAALIQWLGAVYAAFDDVLRLEFNSSVIKIETQHDHFLAVCGILDPRDDAANVCVKAAVRMGRAIAGIMQPDGQPTVVKLGVAAGPLSGGVIGLEVPRFSVFGPPVVCAARMAMTAQESCSGSSVVHISDRAAKNLTRSFLEDDCIVEGLTCGKRGKGMQIKGLGFQQTWEVSSTFLCLSVP
jgi:class 3 adenylate cyclase